jgi:hypothetical protein
MQGFRAPPSGRRRQISAVEADSKTTVSSGLEEPVQQVENLAHPSRLCQGENEADLTTISEF